MPVIGIGVDLVDVARVDKMLASHGDRMLRRLFTVAEVQYAMVRAVPSRHLAARLAAKEAAFKALAGSEDAREIGWTELEVVRVHGGAPSLVLYGRAQERAERLGINGIHLTLTHTHDTAAAVVVLESV